LVGVVVFHIVGKHDELSDVDEFAEFFVAEAVVDTVALGFNPLLVVWFFDLDKSQW
jgi:hypothetical protein